MSLNHSLSRFWYVFLHDTKGLSHASPFLIKKLLNFVSKHNLHQITCMAMVLHVFIDFSLWMLMNGMWSFLHVGRSKPHSQELQSLVNFCFSLCIPDIVTAFISESLYPSLYIASPWRPVDRLYSPSAEVFTWLNERERAVGREHSVPCGCIEF